MPNLGVVQTERRCAIPCWIAALATFAAAEPSVPAQECPRTGKVVVQAIRFSGEPLHYAFKVTNNSSATIWAVTILLAEGDGGRHRTVQWRKAEFDIEPTSIGSPRNWTGKYRVGSDIKFSWSADYGDEGAGILPGRSLSGFAVQLPTAQEWIARRDYWVGEGFDRPHLTQEANEERPGAFPDPTTARFIAQDGYLASDDPCPLGGHVKPD